ncbi:TetR/AcrR family transcriptional regulator [Pseudoclavibacter sp. RFBA6]|uniref:TetR/AcrR family transcriptional regulator n=1 Tax=Pseudoclavibacter sp. RFBA6 TaxID=2080573 RepID=UPI0021587AFE|nr:TetR/AcrR family transcriptional regulator [Pseudoclavibacter sp. RFBA6]
MTESAMSLRARKMARTSRDLAAAARRRALDAGLAGFTIEELCEQVGISRRTFFNYFASKEDAVLGISARRDTAHLDEDFAAGGDPHSKHLSPDLLEALTRLALERWRMDDPEPDPERVREVMAVIDQEPRLFKRVLEHMSSDEKRDVALVERREGLPAGDLRASAAVQILMSVMRASAFEFFTTDNADDMETVVGRRVDAVRAVLHG